MLFFSENIFTREWEVCEMSIEETGEQGGSAEYTERKANNQSGSKLGRRWKTKPTGAQFCS